MDTASAADAARSLGTSIPRVVRAHDRLGLNARRKGGRLALSATDMETLRNELGVTVAEAGDLTRTQMTILAALERAPLGAASARTLARRCGLSPTACSKGVRALEDRGLVKRKKMVIASGRAKEVALIEADRLSPRWRKLVPLLRKVRPPGHPKRPDRTVPVRLRHLFWNTAETQLDVERHGPYVARRLLLAGDLEGLSWGAANLSTSDWRAAASGRGMSPEKIAFANNLAAAADRDIA